MIMIIGTKEEIQATKKIIRRASLAIDNEQNKEPFCCSIKCSDCILRGMCMKFGDGNFENVIFGEVELE